MCVRTFEENKLILMTAYQFQRDLLERGETITRTALAHHVGRQLHVTASGGNCSVAVLLKAWEDEHEILYTERSGAAPRVKARQLKPEHVAEIELFIERNHADRGQSVTVASLVKHLATDRPDFKGVIVSRTVVCYALHHFLGYGWGKIKGKAIKRDPRRPDIIRQYLLDFANALKLEQDGTHILVYVDESYIHQNIAPQFSWLKAHSDGKVSRMTSRGTRVCIVYAITKGGPLCEADSDGRPLEFGDNFVKSGNGKKIQRGSVRNNAEYLFVGKRNTGDYHDMMNNKNFDEWAKDRLVPAFESKYPENKMILVLDNAPYHHNIELPPLGGMSKEQRQDRRSTFGPSSQSEDHPRVT